ncbi:MAG TPA: S41 family peptidase, partial [Nitrospinota bacterium]|nr:S41 family peptidase [Nitrospinota bacterium]
VFREMQLETEGQFGGLGIEITIKDEQLTVVAPIDDTPADKAGIEAGDKIIKINGESTKNITLLQAVKKLRGSKGTKVTITIIREGLDEQKDFTITRDIIKIKSVSKRMLDDKIGYIKIRSFQKNTSKELDVALKELEKGIMHGLIMDLRNNPGGLLEQAVSVSDKFLEGEKLVVFTKGRVKDQNMRFHSKSKDARVKYPMVVLVNAGSASASEIVAGALQDLERAVILGTPTFGKGSVQTVFPLSDGSGLRLTTSKYYTPKGRLIQGKGIIPDILVENRPIKSARLSESEKKMIIIREKDLKNHLKGEGEKSNDKSLKKELDQKSETTILASKEDLQLQRAIDVLKGWKVFKETL